LFLLSAIALFLELVVIRWLSSEIRIFAYFKNLPLIAAFLGFGVGFFLHEKSERLAAWFPRLFFYLSILISGAHAFGLTHVIFVDPRDYFLLGVGFGDHATNSAPGIAQTVKALLVIVGVFFLVVATFACLTARLGALLNRERPLEAYSINVAGSILGIAAFTYVSARGFPPVVWVALALLPLFLFFADRSRRTAFYFTTTVGGIALFAVLNPATWSPYYRISVVEHREPDVPHFIHILVNYDGIQAIQDLSSAHVAQFSEPVQRALHKHYDIPYRIARKKVERVLVLGGGAGNDAAAALRNGAGHVDVVEIDPVIAGIGKRLHPERPYASERVHLHVDDARSFLQKGEEKYDLIVFGALDSHAAFSSLSSLRMDNFVFTRESIRSAITLLRPGGGIAVNFFAIKGWLTQRHFNTLAEEMHSAVLAYGSPTNPEVIFLTGPLFDESRRLERTDFVRLQPPFTAEYVEPTRDDWPFLFLEGRGIPVHYLMPLLIVAVLAVVPLRMTGVRPRKLDWHLFFMGAAFLLIESKAVTSLALILGSTWLVNSIVIGSILLMILLANAVIERVTAPPFWFLYGSLFAALVVNFVFDFDALNALEWNWRAICGGAIISAPLFFAALIFANAFRAVASPSEALAANLFGSLIGGSSISTCGPACGRSTCWHSDSTRCRHSSSSPE
jgi:spermidine synthase